MRVRKRICLVCLGIGMALLLSACGGSEGGIVSGKRVPKSVATTEQSATESLQEDDSETLSKTTGLWEVMAVDTTSGMMKLYNVKKAKQETYAYNDGTFFLDKYGEYVSVSQMQPGKMVGIEISEHTKELTKVQISDQVWEYDDVTKFTIDEENGMITIAGTKYYYKDNLNVFSDEDTIKLSDISDKDVLRVCGINREIFTVAVTSGHGVIQLSNTSLFEGGWLSLGTQVYLKVTENMQIEMQEGTYLLSVANDGWGDSKEITVSRGEVTNVDLNELKGEGPKYCKLTFEVGVEKAVMTIDGEIVDYSKPLEVKYGIHKLEIVADGYDTWSKRLYVNSAEATIQVAMTEESTESESTETETSSASTSDTSSGTTSSGTTSSGTTSSSSSSETTSSDSATDSYLSTLSDIIDTLTNSSSDSD